MAVATIALIAETKCSNWCIDKLTAMTSMLCMVATATAWVHITTTASRAQHVAAIAHGRLLPSSPRTRAKNTAVGCVEVVVFASEDVRGGASAINHARAQVAHT
jgi:hypothetical protein